VNVERRARILAELNAAGFPAITPGSLCAVCTAVTESDGAGIMLTSTSNPFGTSYSDNAVSARIEELQFTLGEGPGVDAHRWQTAVLEPDVANPVTEQWIAFRDPAVEAGAAALFSYPLRVGAVRLGAMTLFRRRVGMMTMVHHTDALVMADVAAQALLMLQDPEASEAPAIQLLSGADFRSVVHQASGMIAAQLDIDVGQALVRLRAHAIGNDRRLADVAEDVVARLLRFDDRPTGYGELL
jgi:ANTAR domain